MPVPALAPLDKESWKYSNISAVLKKLDVAPKVPAWQMTGTFEFLQPDTQDGVIHLVIPAGRRVSLPLDFSLSGKDGHELRGSITVDVGAGAEIVIQERQRGRGSYFKDFKFNIYLSANASVKHYRLCEEDPFAVVVEKTHVTLARDARYAMVAMNGCAGFGRAEFQVDLNGAGADADLAGIALLHGRQHADTTVCINHNAPHGRSSQFFKHILDDESRGVFQGKIFVAKDAQKTDGYQLSNNLLLSSLAEMDVKPELEIYADDVKCSHGSTTGPLDETPLFYLMSRGIDKDAARRLLMEAFLKEISDKITNDSIRQDFETRMRQWMF